jgi:hypothetical protein
MLFCIPLHNAEFGSAFQHSSVAQRTVASLSHPSVHPVPEFIYPFVDIYKRNIIVMTRAVRVPIESAGQISSEW